MRNHMKKGVRCGVNARSLQFTENSLQQMEEDIEESFEDDSITGELLDDADSQGNDSIINIDVDGVNGIDEYIFKVAASIYGASNLTIKHGMEVMKMMKDLSGMIRKFYIDTMLDCENIKEAKIVLSNKNIFDFDDYLTEYKFKKKLTENDLYREPIRFTVSNEAVEVHPGEFKCVEHQGVIMDIEFQIRSFLEIDGILDSILQYQKELAELRPGIYKKKFNGSYWKEIEKKYAGKTIIPVFFYNDDFQIDNQIGPHSGVHSLSPSYYIFPTLPPHLASKLDYIFSALITKAADIKMFGNDSPLYALLSAFRKLEMEGILLYKGSEKETRVYIVGCKVLGDNLGLHTTCGYRQAFTILRP